MLNLNKTSGWNHHRSGWGFCMNSLKPLHSDSGVLVIDRLDEKVKRKEIIHESWIGFVHNVPTHPAIIGRLYGDFHNFDLNKLFQSKTWMQSKNNCKGIFCLSKHNANFVKKHFSKVDVVYHPTEIPKKQFSWSLFKNNSKKRIAMIGHWMRDFQGMFDLKSPYQKTIVKTPEDTFRYERINENFDINDTVDFMEYLPNKEYDNFLSENIVFLKLFDSSANNSIVECMARSTPVLVNRLPAIEEYLGKEYPLFYDNLQEAEGLLADEENIKKAKHYLDQPFLKERINSSNFLNTVKNSSILKALRTFI